MEQNDKDVVKNAIAQAAAKATSAGHLLPEAVREALKIQTEEKIPKVEEVESLEPKKVLRLESRKEEPAQKLDLKEFRKGKGPIWPVEPEQLIEWRALRVAQVKAQEEFVKQCLSPLALDALREKASQDAERKFTTYRPIETKVKEPKEPKEKIVKEKSGRQNRLGQTKLIDDLLKQGKNEKEIFDAVRLAIPSYPADKLPKLIKLRQYHVKK